MTRGAGNAKDLQDTPGWPGSRDGKRVELHSRQRGATNPQPLRGESRRGGERPRGRNMSRRVAPSARRELRLPGVDTQKVERQRGIKRANPMRGGTRDLFGGCEEFQRSQERSEGEAKGHEGRHHQDGRNAFVRRARPGEGLSTGIPRGPGRQRPRSRRERERPSDPLPRETQKKTQCPTGTATSVALKATPTP